MARVSDRSTAEMNQERKPLGSAIATRYSALDRGAAWRAGGVLVVVFVILVVGYLAAQRTDAGGERDEVAEQAAARGDTDDDLISSWPAGPLAGPAPRVISDQETRADGCADAVSGEELTMEISGSVSLWLFSESTNGVSAQRIDDLGTIVHDIPPDYFDHPFTTGRVTLSVAADDSAVVTIRSKPGPIRVCGLSPASGP